MAQLRLVLFVGLAIMCVSSSRLHAASLAAALGAANQDVLDAQKAALLTVGRLSNNIDIDIDITNNVTVNSGGSGGSGHGGCSPPKFNHCGQPVFPTCPKNGHGGSGGGHGSGNVTVVINISIEIIIKIVTTSSVPPASPSRCCRCFGF